MKPSKGRITVLVASIVFALGTFTAPAAQNVTNNSVVWAVSYDGDFLPNNGSSDPAWSTFFVGAGASGTVGGGILTLTNGGASITYAEMNNTSYWNGGSGGTFDNTIEFKMRGQNAQSNADWTGRFFFGDGVNRWFFSFDDNRVRINGSPFYLIDTTIFHTYRIVESNSLVSLYVDQIGNNSTPVLSGVAGSAVAQNFIYFGHDGTALKGRTEWDYVRWTNAGAFTVPEPGAFTLILAALALLRLARY